MILIGSDIIHNNPGNTDRISYILYNKPENLDRVLRHIALPYI